MVAVVMVPKVPDSVAKQHPLHLPLLNEACGDEADSSAAFSIKPGPVETCGLSSLDETPCGDGSIVLDGLPVNSHILQCCTFG